MAQITIHIPDADAEWLLGLLSRLHVPYQVELDQSKIERAKAIILRGADTLDAVEMLTHVNEARQDRKLPFRSE